MDPNDGVKGAHGVPPPPYRAPAPAPDPVSTVSKGVFARAKGMVKGALFEAAGVVVRGFVENANDQDEKILKAVFGDNCPVEANIQSMAPDLLQFLSEDLLKGAVQEFFEKEDGMMRKRVPQLLLHVFANLTLAQLPEEMKDRARKGERLPAPYCFTVEQVTQKATLQIGEILSRGLNQADAKVCQGAKVDTTLFNPMVEELYNLIIPKGDTFDTVIFPKNRIINAATSKLCDLYQPFVTWFGGKEFIMPSGIELTPEIKQDLTKLGAFIAGSVSDKFLAEDRAFFEQLTGEANVHEIIQKFSPELRELILQMLPGGVQELLKPESASAEQAAEAVMMRVLAKIAKTVFAKQLNEHTEISVEEMVKGISNYIAQRFKATFSALDQSQNEVKVEDLDPFALELIELVLPENPLFTGLIERRKDRLCRPVSKMLYDLYNLRVKDDGEIEKYRQRLRKIFWNRDQIAALEIDGKRFAGVVPLQPTLEFSKDAGIEPTVEQLYNLCCNIVKGTRDQLWGKLQSPSDVVNQLGELAGIKAGDAKGDLGLERLARGINGAFEDESDHVSWMGEEIERSFVLLLFKGLVKTLEIVPAEDRYPPEKLLATALSQLLEKVVPDLATGFAKLQGECNEIDQSGDEPEIKVAKKIEAARDLVTPLMNDLIVFLSDTKQGVDKIRGIGLIKGQLTSVVAKLLVTGIDWMGQTEKNKDRLKELYESEQPVLLCENLGKMTAEGIPFAFREKRGEIVGLIMKIAEPWLHPPAFGFAPPLQPVMIERFQGMVGGVIDYVGMDKSGAHHQLSQFVGSFTESLLLRLLADTSEKISKMEEERVDDNPTTLVETMVLSGIKRLKEHFEGIVNAKKAMGRQKKKPRTPAELRASFVRSFRKQHILNPGAKDAAGKDEFMRTWAHSVTRLVGLNESTPLPIPQLVRAPLIAGVEEKLLPLLLMIIFESATDPTTLNKALLSLFDRLDNAIAEEVPEEEPRRKFNDEYQGSLENVMGELTQALVRLQPGKMPRLLMAIKSMRKWAGEAMGQPLREQLRISVDTPRPLLELVNAGLEIINEKLKPDDKGCFPLFFPSTEEEKEIAKQTMLRDRRRAEAEVPTRLHKVINHQTDKMMRDLNKRTWKKIEDAVCRWIEKVFGRYAEKAKKILIPILKVCVGYPLKGILFAFRYLIWVPIRAVLSFYIRSQSQERVKDVELPIHDNLAYHIIHDAMERLTKEIVTENLEHPLEAEPTT